MSHSLEQATEALRRTYPGPGGACAVLRRGEVLVRHSWGYANAERRIAFTPDTLFRICSITKQFTCATLLAEFPDPTVLDADIGAMLPNLQQPPPGALHVCHNQSGLRDYWAVAMLHGAPAESAFGDSEAGKVFAATQTLQFAPGTRFSYTNQNFRIVSDILQQRTGKSFAALLRQHLFDPAGMHGAILAADTRSLPDGTEGYEGTQETGFRAAENRILWTGDAGIAATLNDMIAWERHIDATRDDPAALYHRLSAPVHFADGAPASYGFGLGRRTEFGHALTGHGGALRGWRSHRLYVPAERISVVVMFNHLSDASAAAMSLLEAALGVRRPPAPPCELPGWLGAYIEPQTRLAARIDATPDRQLRLRYGHNAERLAPQADGSAGTDGTRLVPSEAGLWMHRPTENQSSLLQRCQGTATLDVAGCYRCDELNTELTVEDAGGALYGAFSGFLGQGRMELLTAIGADVWALPCPRALDHTPPGDWTLAFARGDHGRVQSVAVGCWLARGLTYLRQY
jgi:D-aminopeptidase